MCRSGANQERICTLARKAQLLSRAHLAIARRVATVLLPSPSSNASSCHARGAVLFFLDASAFLMLLSPR